MSIISELHRRILVPPVLLLGSCGTSTGAGTATHGDALTPGSDAMAGSDAKRGAWRVGYAAWVDGRVMVRVREQKCGESLQLFYGVFDLVSTKRITTETM
jgi:hypothetical protein